MFVMATGLPTTITTNKQALVPQYLGLTMDSQQTNQTNEHSKMVETF